MCIDDVCMYIHMYHMCVRVCVQFCTDTLKKGSVFKAFVLVNHFGLCSTTELSAVLGVSIEMHTSVWPVLSTPDSILYSFVSNSKACVCVCV